MRREGERGKWRMENGEGRMENGEWRMEIGAGCRGVGVWARDAPFLWFLTHGNEHVFYFYYTTETPSM